MVHRCYNGAMLAELSVSLFPEETMKALIVLAASLALALAGCNRDQNAAGGRTAQPKSPSSAAGGSSSMQTPGGAASGQSSEGSTDKSTAPKQPSSK